MSKTEKPLQKTHKAMVGSLTTQPGKHKVKAQQGLGCPSSTGTKETNPDKCCKDREKQSSRAAKEGNSGFLLKTAWQFPKKSDIQHTTQPFHS